MQDEQTPTFGHEHATNFDQRHAKLAPMRDALHLLIRMLLAELPTDARILCVGAGTGAELLYLAAAFPRWRFCAVDPSAAMLKICHERAQSAGIASRCTFHEGHLASLPPSAPFDAATSLLVSHFMVDPELRRDFFAQIAARLRPGGSLVSADLASDMTAPSFARLRSAWAEALRYSGIPAAQVEKQCASFGQHMAMLPVREVESIIASAGFEPPAVFFQALLMHGWHAKIR